jgi:hypothetical protein
MSRAIVGGLGAERAYLTMWVDKPPLHVHLVLYPRWPTDEKRGWDLDVERWAAGPPPEDRGRGCGGETSRLPGGAALTHLC